jgi:hypothetical protein
MTESAAVVKRLETMLKRQTQKLNAYGRLLEKEAEAINSLDFEKLISQQEVEQSLIQEILALDKVIVSLEKLYQSSPQVPGIESLREELTRTRQKVWAENNKNQQLAQTKLTGLKKERDQLKKHKQNPSSPYSQVPPPSLVDISY